MNSHDEHDENLTNYPCFADELDKRESGKQQGLEKPVDTRPDIATKAELEQLRAERDQPVIAQNYTIGGSIEQHVHSKENANREKRIAALRERLGRPKNRARDDFNRTQQHQDMMELDRER